jgi:N-acyl-D-aspartate/D-glutamate deacylase
MTTQIRNVTIYDGTGAPPYLGDVWMTGGRIAPPSASADVVIDGTGLAAAPGFIDVHSHGDFCLGSAYHGLSHVSQGVTTQITGHCGKSVAVRTRPMYDELARDQLAPLPCPGYDDPALFETFEGYLAYVRHLPLIENTAFLIGHGNLRRWVMGYDDRPPTDGELRRMCAMLESAMAAGALGLSSGLYYIPGAYADIDEMAALCAVVARRRGVYATHLRDESGGVLAALDEALETARRAGCRLNISHLKVGGGSRGRAETVLARIAEARRLGLQVAADQYPYTAGATDLGSCIPPWHFTAGPDALLEKLRDADFRAALKAEIQSPDAPFDNAWLDCGSQGIFVGDCAQTLAAKGRSIADWAAAQGIADPLDALFDLIIDNRFDAMGIYFGMDEADVTTILREPSVMVGCDSAAPAPGTAGHPRAFGTFTRVLGHYSRDLALLPMETMIHKMTGLPADFFGLTAKGRIAPGFDADLVLFNPATVADAADYGQPDRRSFNVEAVFIGGQRVYSPDGLTDCRPGQALLLSPDGTMK